MGLYRKVWVPLSVCIYACNPIIMDGIPLSIKLHILEISDIIIINDYNNIILCKKNCSSGTSTSYILLSDIY